MFDTERESLSTVEESSVEFLDAVVESESYAGETHLSLESRGQTAVEAPAITRSSPLNNHIFLKLH